MTGEARAAVGLAAAIIGGMVAVLALTIWNLLKDLRLLVLVCILAVASPVAGQQCQPIGRWSGVSWGQPGQGKVPFAFTVGPEEAWKVTRASGSTKIAPGAPAGTTAALLDWNIVVDAVNSYGNCCIQTAIAEATADSTPTVHLEGDEVLEPGATIAVRVDSLPMTQQAGIVVHALVFPAWCLPYLYGLP